MMPTIVGLRIPAVELPHAERQIRLGGLDEQMIVIVRQAIGVADPPIAINDMGQETAPLGTVTVVRHDVPPRIDPARDMVDGPAECKAKRTGHEAGIHPAMMCDCKT
jgi:hypothetical protein